MVSAAYQGQHAHRGDQQARLSRVAGVSCHIRITLVGFQMAFRILPTSTQMQGIEGDVEVSSKDPA
jgi:hypothetical protein